MPGKVLSVPITVFLNVTNRCNLRCLHCEPSSGEPLTEELDTQTILALIDSFAVHRVFKVSVSGGEPLVHKDLFRFLERLVGHRISVTLFTNAMLVTDRLAQKLADRKLHHVSVSLDGASPATHDQLRGLGAFEKTVAGIRRLVSYGVPVSLGCVVTRLNYHELPEIVGFARSLGVMGISVNQLHHAGRAVQNMTSLGLTPAEHRMVAEALEALQPRYKGFLGGTYLSKAAMYCREVASGKPRTIASCSAGSQAMAIQADGSVTLCNYLTSYIAGNVRDQQWLTVWRESPQMQAFRDLMSVTVDQLVGCEGCRYHSVCDGGCRAGSYAVAGHLLARDPNCWYRGGEGAEATTQVVPTYSDTAASRFFPDPSLQVL